MGVAAMCVVGCLVNRVRIEQPTESEEETNNEEVNRTKDFCTCIIKIGGSACTIKDSV